MCNSNGAGCSIVSKMSSPGQQSTQRVKCPGPKYTYFRMYKYIYPIYILQIVYIYSVDPVLSQYVFDVFNCGKEIRIMSCL